PPGGMVSPWRAVDNHDNREVLHHPLNMHVSPTAVVGALCVMTLVACGGTATGAPAASTVPAGTVTAKGTFAAPPAAFATYDSALVPAGASANVDATEGPASTSVTLTVAGLPPN